ncbi:hypothetical protein [Dactylosporangium sp. CA-139066]|uniref:hypothetical protein n=1 Tax=Dactylosporangium sp. CA-139066 TaxID=3239930 RepID=UPI003D935E02
MTVVDPAALAGLAGGPGPRRLTVVGGEVATMPRLPALEHVRFVACRLGDLGALLDCPALRRRDLLFSALPTLAANDDEVLLAAAGGTVAGVPHSSAVAAYRAERGDPTSEYERIQCVRLWERTGAVFGAGLLVRPGPFDAVRIAATELERELARPGFSLEAVFARYPPLPHPDPAALLSAAADPPGAALLRWSAAELWPPERAGADRFAQRFPHARLRTDPPAFLDAVAGHYARRLPAAYLLRSRIAKWLLLRDAPELHLARFPGHAWRLGLAPTGEPAPGGHLGVGRSGEGWTLAATTGETERVLRLDRDGRAERAYGSFRDLLDDVTEVGVSRPAGA